MIDWSQTTVEKIKAKKTDIVVVICDKCQMSRSIKYVTWKNQIRLTGSDDCSSCKAKANRERYRDSYKKSDKLRSESLSKTYKEKWQNSEYRENQLKLCTSDEVRNKHSKTAKKLWKDKSYRNNVTTSVKNLYRDSAYVKKMKKIYDSREYREKLAVRWKNEEFKAKLINSIRDSLIKKWELEEYKRAMAIARSKMPKYGTKIEIKLYDILKNLDVKYEKQYPLGFYVFDCFLPDYNILIECNGDYWHNLSATRRNDKSKSTYIEKYFPKIKLYYIWEHEFKCHDRVTELIKYWTGTNENLVDFDFMEVKMMEINKPDEYKTFLGNYHYLQSAGSPIHKYGFYYNDKLIAVCLYAYLTRKESAIRLKVAYKDVLELTRLCIHPGYQKKNFASWIISKTIREVKNLKKYQVLISFADKTFNHDGVVYKASNWTLDGIVPASYWYIDRDGFVMNKKTLYNHARSLKMKEGRFAEIYGYSKIKGSIKQRFIYHLDSK